MKKAASRLAIKVYAKKQKIPFDQLVDTVEKEIKDACARTQAEKEMGASLWADIPHSGETPTAFELVAYLADKVSAYPNRKSIWD